MKDSLEIIFLRQCCWDWCDLSSHTIPSKFLLAAVLL